MASWPPGRSRTISLLPSPPSTSTRTSFEQHTSPLKAIFLLLPISHARRSTRQIIILLTSLLLLLLVAAKYGYVDTDGKEGWWSLRIAYRSTTASSIDNTTVAEPPKPLTELGFEADLVYENMGSIDTDEYRIELETFLQRSFPTTDSNATDPDSLLSILHEFLPPPPAVPPVPHPRSAFRRMVLLPFQTVFQAIDGYFKAPAPPPLPRPDRNIPRKLHQTAWFPGSEPPEDIQNSAPKTWRWKNPNYEYHYSDNEAAKEFMLGRFNNTDSREFARYSIADTYVRMKEVPVMQSDFWRYSVLASEGGVYSDLDTRCLRPIDTWHRFPWQRELTVFQNEPRPRPSMIVGIEVDVGNRQDWHAWWPRPLGIVQWTMAGTRGHPILIDTMRRVSEVVNPYHVPGQGGNISENALGIMQGSARKLDSVVEKSGPGPFTDSVLRYLGAKYNVTWPTLQHLPDEGILFTDTDGHADVLVLSVTAFSPGVGNFGAGDVLHAAALVQHLFSGSWKAQHG